MKKTRIYNSKLPFFIFTTQKKFCKIFTIQKQFTTYDFGPKIFWNSFGFFQTDFSRNIFCLALVQKFFWSGFGPKRFRTGFGPLLILNRFWPIIFLIRFWSKKVLTGFGPKPVQQIFRTKTV